MSERVFITGTGIICAIGNTTQVVLESIRQSKHGIGFPTFLNTIHQFDFPVGEVKYSNNELYNLVQPKKKTNLSRTALLGMIAAKEALKNAGIKNISEFRTGLISATTVGGMDKTETFFPSFINNPNSGRLRNIITHDCGDSTEQIAEHLGIKDYITTISTACSSSANAIMLGARLIKNNILDRVVVGGTDALTKFTLNGFNSLMILDKSHCRPFDETRNGLNLGEGAGFVILESEKSIKANNKNIICELKGYGNACDAFHQTASSPDGYGACLAISKAFETSGLNPEDIDYINAHGTGTPNNDLTEGKAIEKIFGNKNPMFSSTKSYTGHTLAASGGIEAVFSCLAIQHQLIFPNLNFSNQMKELEISPVNTLIHKKPVRNVLSNSFGFGGNNTTLIFSKY